MVDLHWKPFIEALKQTLHRLRGSVDWIGDGRKDRSFLYRWTDTCCINEMTSVT